MQIHLVRLECTQGNSNKFYEMRAPVSGGGDFTVTYGRIGTYGTSAQYPMSKWQTKYLEKLKKGYVVVRDEIVTVTSGATPGAAASVNSGRPNTVPKNTAKYSFTGEAKEINGETVYRIMSNIEFVRADGRIVKAGDIGGWVNNVSNLAGSKNSRAWVADDAILLDTATVVGDALVADEAIVRDEATILGRAQIRGKSVVEGKSMIDCDAVIGDLARVSGSAVVTDRAVIDGQAQVSGNVKICEDVWLTEHASAERKGCDAVLSGKNVYSGLIIW